MIDWIRKLLRDRALRRQARQRVRDADLVVTRRAAERIRENVVGLTLKPLRERIGAPPWPAPPAPPTWSRSPAAEPARDDGTDLALRQLAAYEYAGSITSSIASSPAPAPDPEPYRSGGGGDYGGGGASSSWDSSSSDTGSSCSSSDT